MALPRVDALHVLSCCGLTFFLFAVPAVLAGRLLRRRVVLHYHGGETRSFFRIATTLSAPDGLLASYIDLKEMERMRTLHRARKLDATDRIWRLLNLQLWGDIFLGKNAERLSSVGSLR